MEEPRRVQQKSSNERYYITTFPSARPFRQGADSAWRDGIPGSKFVVDLLPSKKRGIRILFDGIDW